MTNKSDKIVAPFSQEQVEAINYWQNGPGHSFTCCSYNDCERDKQPKHGQLIATIDGMICPCGDWKQNWVHDCMIEDPYNMFPEGMKKIWKRREILKVIELLRINAKNS